MTAIQTTAAAHRRAATDRRVGDGPLVVIAGAGTGKTRVIVERVRWLLETKGDAAGSGRPLASRPDRRPLRRAAPPGADPRPDLQRQGRAGARSDRIEAGGRAGDRAARMTVSNFHSFCHRILTESTPPMPGCRRNPDVLDGVGQVLLLRDIRPDLPLIYHWQNRMVARPVRRVHQPGQGRARHAGRLRRLRRRGAPRLRGSATAATSSRSPGSRSRATSRLRARSARRYAELPRAKRDAPRPRGEDAAQLPTLDARSRRPPTARPAARSPATATPARASHFDAAISAPDRRRSPTTYVVDGAALEVMRLSELGAVYRAYQAELARRGALDFGEQIAAVAQLFKTPAQRPPPLAAPVPLPARRRVPGRQRRPDRAHRAARPDARPARQRHGRRRRRPVDLPLPRRQLRGLRRVRSPLLAAAGPRPDARRPARRRAFGSSRTSARPATSWPPPTG